MTIIDPKEWQPSGVGELEPTAFEVVRSQSNMVVIAGPGSGKTEILAQRACFLLQTGMCPSPFRILAISFKRDAAKNLQDRVRKRCGKKLSQRFDSMTFDAFAKGLLDRFYRALPANYPVSTDYEIRFDIEHSYRGTLRDRLVRAGENKGLVNAILRSKAEEQFFKHYVIGQRLEDKSQGGNPDQIKLAADFWADTLTHGGRSTLNFAMIGRLAELILSENSKIRTALHATYGFLFLDEFQDTTNVQYDLTMTAFCGSNCFLTAVGDPKQRIMVWAGALDGIFQRFKDDFTAESRSVVMNYRSAPQLVAMQQYLIASLDAAAPKPKAFHTDAKGEGSSIIFEYDTVESEARHLAAQIRDTLTDGRLTPRDVCILTRNWNDTYSELITQELAQFGIKARVEKTLQDLISEPIVLVQLSFLKLALSERDADAWDAIIDTLSSAESCSSKNERQLEIRLATFTRKLRGFLDRCGVERVSISKVLTGLITFLGVDRLKSNFPQYAQGTFLEDLQKQLTDELEVRLSKGNTWLDAVLDIQGRDSVPIMTVHKSKGLEYHTVIFVGLEDSAFWAFDRDPAEEKCAFFVAFSRAITRVIFTYCKTRPKKFGERALPQSHKSIAVFYDLLASAGVRTEKISSPR